MMRSSFCCQLQHPLPPSLSNVWWDIKRRHWATRDGCTPRDGTCLQCLEAVGVLWNPSPTILEPKTCLKNPEKTKISFRPTEKSCTSSKVQSEIGIGWTWTWWPSGMQVPKKTVTIRDTTIPPSYVSDSPVSGDIANCSSSWWNCTVFFHSSPTNNYIILTSSVANLSNILARSIYQVDWTFVVVLCAPRQCHPSFPHPPSLGQTWKLQHGSNYQSSEYLKPRVMFFETIL